MRERVVYWITSELEGDQTVLLESATNGNPRAFSSSHREHEAVFVGSDPEKVLEAALRDRQWTSEARPAAVELEDGMKRKFKLNSLKYDAVSQMSYPNGHGEFVVTLFGNEQLEAADLSHVVVTLREEQGASRMLSPSADTREMIGGEIRTKITFPYIAPASLGAHKITFNLPGTAIFEQPILVVGIP
jgi:hypothetical protein